MSEQVPSKELNRTIAELKDLAIGMKSMSLLLQANVVDRAVKLLEQANSNDTPQFFRNEDGDIDFGPVATHEPPAAPHRMRIAFQPQGRCLWHEDCVKASSGVMREVEHEESRSLLECLNCGQRGYYPKGAVGSVCVDVVGRSTQPPLATGCHRSHPHEDMNAECERLTEIARENNRRANEPSPEPAGYRLDYTAGAVEAFHFTSPGSLPLDLKGLEEDGRTNVRVTPLYRAAQPPAPARQPSKFDLAFEIMRQLEAEDMETMQSCQFGYVMRVTKEGHGCGQVEFRPIETAPKDGSTILLRCPKGIVEGCWEQVDGGGHPENGPPIYWWTSPFTEFIDGPYDAPTHWALIPRDALTKEAE